MSTPEFNSIEIAPKSPLSFPKHRAAARKNAIAKAVVASLVLSGIPFLAYVQNSNEPALASGADTIGLYLSAPLAQGTDVTVDVARENFDSATVPGDCSAALTPIASITLSRGGQVTANTDRTLCQVRAGADFGGASTDSAVRTFGGTASQFMQIPGESLIEEQVTFEFPNLVKYVGFHWQAGNAGNTVRFFDSTDTLLAEFTSETIIGITGTSNTSNETLQSFDASTSYEKRLYFGNPRGRNSLTATSSNGIDAAGVYTYLNLYVGGSLDVKKVQFAGNNFEFDNVAVSTAVQVPAGSMVKVTDIARATPAGGGGGGGGDFVPTAPVQAVKADPCTAVASTTAVNRKAKNFSGFAINSARLTPTMKTQIRTWLNKHPEEVCVSVAGFTMGPSVLPTDPKLAKDRARSMAAYIKSLRPQASFTPITSRTQRLVGDDIRRAKVTLRF